MSTAVLLGGTSTILMAIIAFLGKNVLSELKSQGKDIAVIKAEISNIKQNTYKYENRLYKLETSKVFH